MRNLRISMVCIILGRGVAVRDGCCARMGAMLLGQWRENVAERIRVARYRGDQDKEYDTAG